MQLARALSFVRSHHLAVLSTTHASGAPQAAVIGIAVTDAFEIVFDTLSSTRKFKNLLHEPRVALVVGWDEVTLQLEGLADVPHGEELERLRAHYLTAFPDGSTRLAWSGITHVRVRPQWIRMSDFSHDPPLVEELSLPAVR